LVHRGQRRAGEAVGVAVDGEQRDAVGRAGRDEQQVGHVAVEDEHLRAVDAPPVTVLRGGGLDARFVPLAVRLGERERRNGLARRDPGQVSLLRRLVAGVEQRVGRQHHGGVVGGAQQGPAHLLEDDRQLDVRVPLAAVLLGDGQGLQSQLVRHLRPDCRVVAVRGVHQPPDLGLGRLRLEELPGDPAQLFLLFGEGEVHGPAP
jgi:hypothetical protein